MSYAQTFQQYRLAAIDNLRAVRDMTVDNYSSRPLEELRALFTAFVAQRKLFQAIPLQQDVGTIRVDSRAVKLQLTPSPDQCVRACVACVCVCVWFVCIPMGVYVCMIALSMCCISRLRVCV